MAVVVSDHKLNFQSIIKSSNQLQVVENLQQ